MVPVIMLTAILRQHLQELHEASTEHMVLLLSAFAQLGGHAGSVSPAVDDFLGRLTVELQMRIFDGPVSTFSMCCWQKDRQHISEVAMGHNGSPEYTFCAGPSPHATGRCTNTSRQLGHCISIRSGHTAAPVARSQPDFSAGFHPASAGKRCPT